MDVTSLPDDPQTLKDLILQMNLAQQRQLDIQRDQQAAIAQHQQTIGTLQEQQQQYQQRIDKLEDLLAWFKRKVFGPRSEKINANQLLLFGESILPLTTAVQQKMPVQVKANRPAAHGRRMIPQDLPREVVVIPVAPEQKACPACGQEREKIGEVISEQLDYIPARLLVRKFVQEKRACRRCEANVVLAPKPAQVLEKGLAGPGLIAHIATAKYADHLPLYRLEGIFARSGIEISRSTMCDWMGDVAKLARPLVELMHQRILTGKVIHSDDTTVPVQQQNKTKVGRLWVYIGDADNPYNVYDYTPDRKKEHPHTWLGGYGGYLQADAYGGYDQVYASGQVKEVACWAHARRKFVEAKDKSPEICQEALGRIGHLYAVEQEARECSESERHHLRQHKSVAILQEMGEWLRRVKGQLLPKNPAAEAIGYALNQWEALCRYTDQGYLAIDNNAAEREMRPVALGRKNWLFAGSDEGGKTAAILYSLIRSALRQQLNVEYYLRSIFAHLPGTRLSELPHLLPDVWKRELAQEIATCPDHAKP